MKLSSTWFDVFLANVKSRGRWLQIFETFTECPNFTNKQSLIFIVWIKTNDNSKWLFYLYFWPFSCQLNVYLSQNWGSDSHFDVLDKSKSYFVQKLWHIMQIFPYLDLANFRKNGNYSMAILWQFLEYLQFCFFTKSQKKKSSEPHFSERQWS